LEEIDNLILPKSRSLSDYAPLTVDIFIIKKYIQDKWQTIIRNSKEEERFILELKNTIRNIDTTDLSSKELLEEIVYEYMRISDSIWYKFSENINITKCSKTWWNKECRINLNKY